MKFLGNIDGDKQERLYAMWDGKQVKYILDDDEIGVYAPDVMEAPILFMNNTKANELSAEVKDTIQNLAKNLNLEELKEMEKKYDKNKQQELAEVLGIEREQVKSISEVDLKQKVKTVKEKPEEKREGEKRKEKGKTDTKEKEEMTTKNVNVKQEVKMSAMASDMQSLGRVLRRAGKMPNIPGKTFDKMGVVESSDVKNVQGKTNTTRFYLVAIATDGTVVPLDLKQDRQEGNNPREISYYTRTDGAIEQDDVLSRYTVGNSGETISIKHSNGPGYIELGYSPRKTLGRGDTEGNVSIDTQLETRTVTWRPDMRVRESYFRGDEFQDDRFQEAKEETRTDSPQMKRGEKGAVVDRTYEDIDGREQTKSDHDHEDIDLSNDVDLEKAAQKIMKENEEVKNTFTQKGVVERLKRELSEGKTLEEATNNIKADGSRFYRERH